MNDTTHFTIVVPYAADTSADADLVRTYARSHFYHRMWEVAPDASIKEYIVKQLRKFIMNRTADPSAFKIATYVHVDSMDIDVLRGGRFREVLSIKVYYSRGQLVLHRKLDNPKTEDNNENNQ